MGGGHLPSAGILIPTLARLPQLVKLASTVIYMITSLEPCWRLYDSPHTSVVYTFQHNWIMTNRDSVLFCHVTAGIQGRGG